MGLEDFDVREMIKVDVTLISGQNVFVWLSDIIVILSTYQNTTFKYIVCVLCAYLYIMRSHFIIMSFPLQHETPWQPSQYPLMYMTWRSLNKQ